MATSKAADWKKLTCFGKSAKEIPGNLRSLFDDSDELERVRALGNLRVDCVLPGQTTRQRCEAAEPLISELLKKLPKSKQPREALCLLADLVGADFTNGYLSDTPPEMSVTVLAAIRAFVLAGLGSDLPAVRAGSAVLAATLDCNDSDLQVGLCKLAQEDKDPSVVVSAIVAMGRCASISLATLKTKCKKDPELVQGAIAFAQWRQAVAGGEKQPLESVLQSAWMIRDSRAPLFLAQFFDHFGSHEVPLERIPALPLVTWAKRQRRDHELLGAIVNVSKDSKADDVGGWALDRAILLLAELKLPVAAELADEDEDDDDDDGQYRVRKLEELTPFQLEIAHAIADTMLIAEAKCFPAPGVARRRWLGLSPKSILEEPYTKTGDPIWFAWSQYRNHTPHPRDSVFSAVRAAPQPAQYLALVEVAWWTYGFGDDFSASEVEPEVQLALASAGLLDGLTLLTKDYVKRLAQHTQCIAAESFKVRDRVSLGLLLLPFVRLQQPIPDGAESLLFEDEDPLIQELLLSLPKARRAKVGAAPQSQW